MKFTNKTFFFLVFSNFIISYTKTQENHVENYEGEYINLLEKNLNTERVIINKEFLRKTGK